MRKLNWFVLIVVVLSLSLGLVACGGDDDNGGGDKQETLPGPEGLSFTQISR